MADENILVRAIDEQRWDFVMERLQTLEGREEARAGFIDIRVFNFQPQSRYTEITYPSVLYLACDLGKAPFNVIKALLDSHPEAVKKKHEVTKDVPLHAAILEHMSFDITKMLLNAYSEAAKIERNPDNDEGNQANELPLHLAMQNERDFIMDEEPDCRLIQALVEAYPDGAKMMNYYGQIPLHFTANFSCVASIQVVRTLLDAYPNGAKITDHDGNIPLHSISFGLSTEIVATTRALLEAYPEGVKMRNKLGRLPIHEVAKSMAPPELIQTLINAYPESVKEPVVITDTDDRYDIGFLPIHSMCHSLRSASREDVRHRDSIVFPVMKVLLSSYPDSVIITCRDRNNNNNLSFPKELVPREARECRKLLKEYEEKFFVSCANEALS